MIKKGFVFVVSFFVLSSLFIVHVFATNESSGNNNVTLKNVLESINNSSGTGDVNESLELQEAEQIEESEVEKVFIDGYWLSKSEAEEYKVSMEAFKQFNQESRAEAKEMGITTSSNLLRSGGPCVNGGQPNVPIRNARYYGDIWFEASTAYGIPTGHVGIYWNYTKGAHALLGGVTVFTNARGVCPGAVKMDVQTLSVSSQDKASNWAWSKQGYSYDVTFADNRRWPLTIGVNNQGDFNCSGLVWSAYYATAGVDLDGTGGDMVLPIDIVMSWQTRVYETKWW